MQTALHFNFSSSGDAAQPSATDVSGPATPLSSSHRQVEQRRFGRLRHFAQAARPASKLSSTLEAPVASVAYSDARLGSWQWKQASSSRQNRALRVMWTFCRCRSCNEVDVPVDLGGIGPWRGSSHAGAVLVEIGQERVTKKVLVKHTFTLCRDFRLTSESRRNQRLPVSGTPAASDLSQDIPLLSTHPNSTLRFQIRQKSEDHCSYQSRLRHVVVDSLRHHVSSAVLHFNQSITSLATLLLQLGDTITLQLLP